MALRNDNSQGLSLDSPTRARPEKHVPRLSGLRRGRGAPSSATREPSLRNAL
jgi:hypothetical protein